jgi:hypothetical protein
MLPEQASRSMPCVDFCNACGTVRHLVLIIASGNGLPGTANVFWNISMQGFTGAALPPWR